jgi:nitrate reductase gamma subunit
MRALGWLLVGATYAVLAACYLRLALHALTWWEAARRAPAQQGPGPGVGAAVRSFAGAALDILLLRRLLRVNPALWLGEWGFHAALAAILLRHLRFFADPVPALAAFAQTPGWIAAFLLPAAVGLILVIRLLTGLEKFSSKANLLMLLNILGIGATGLLLSTRFRVDLVAVKLFALGIVTFAPAPPPPSLLLDAHLVLVLALLLYLPSHVVTAPLTILDARRRALELQRIMHDA